MFVSVADDMFVESVEIGIVESGVVFLIVVVVVRCSVFSVQCFSVVAVRVDVDLGG